MLNNKDLYDNSEYKESHPAYNLLYNTSNKKVIGKFKDESAKSIMIEAISIRLNVYSYITEDNYNSKRDNPS